MAKLSDKQKKRIIVERANGKSLTQLAGKFHVSTTTIARVCKQDPETAKMVKQKKEQNTLDMLAFMDEQKNSAQKLLASIIEAMNDPAKLEKANIKDLATAFGIITDKFTKNIPSSEKEETDDGFLSALNEKAAEIWADGDDNEQEDSDV